MQICHQRHQRQRLSFFAMPVAIFSDYLVHGFIIVLNCILIAMIGFIVLPVPNLHSSFYYGTLILAALGAYAAKIVCWFNASPGGHLKQSVGRSRIWKHLRYHRYIRIFAKCSPKIYIGGVFVLVI